MPVLEIVVIALLGAAGWLWLDSLKVREAALRAGRAACASEGLMLLDDTVAIAGLKLVRNDAGRVQIQRSYVFEYTDNGNNRLTGSVVMLAHRVIMLNVGVRNRELRTLN